MSRLALLVLIVLFGYARDVCAQRVLRLDFGWPSHFRLDHPWNWAPVWSTMEPWARTSFNIDITEPDDRATGMRIVGTDSSAAPPLRTTALQLPATFARGHALVLRGEQSAKGLSGRAVVQFQSRGLREVVAADSAVLVPGEDDTQWRPFALTIPAPLGEDVRSIFVGLGLAGRGVASFRGLTLQLHDPPIAERGTDDVAPTDTQLQWLAARSAPLRTVEPPPSGVTPRDADLALFDRMVGDARVVGLGASVDGTRELFQVKHRLLEHLVRTQGFRVVAIPAHPLSVERLNAYVMGGRTSVQDVLPLFYRAWQSEEMLALVEWARRHNAAQPDAPLCFVGYDVQDHRLPITGIARLTMRHEPALLARVGELYGPYQQPDGNIAPRHPNSPGSGWLERADSLWQEVSARRQRWLAASATRADSLAVEWAVQEANVLRQGARLDVSIDDATRDSLRAANLDWAMRVVHPGARTVVWGHDVHVNRGQDRDRAPAARGRMGALLAQRYGDGYRAFSLVARAGNYSASRGAINHTIDAEPLAPVETGSVEQVVSALPRPRSAPGLVIDLRGGSDDPNGAWLWQPRRIRSVQYAVYDSDFERRTVMSQAFDGVIFVDSVGPLRMLAR